MKKLLVTGLAAVLALSAGAAPQKEKLGRGAVAVATSSSKVALSWRSFTADDPSISFDIYKNGAKLTSVSNSTFYSASGSISDDYEIRAVLNGQTLETFAPVVKNDDLCIRLHLDRPAGGKTPDGVSYTYTPNDCSVGDVDGDGEYEIIVKWDPSNSADNSQQWYTGNVILDCYRLDGTKLWRIDLGRNIRAGAHYTQFMVYDFDGDGKAEMACKTAPGTIDGQGKPVLMGSDKVDADYRNSKGVIMTGSEYLTMFDGLTGAEITTVSYVPLRSVHSQSKNYPGWGDDYANRSERYLACVAYLDGQHPSLVMCRGYYTHAYLCAWDFDGKNLTQRWLHASTTKGQELYGEGAHSLTVGDVDGDGCDEIIYGSAAVDHDGKFLHRTGAGHGDALHLGDFDPDRPGLEVFMVHEEKSSSYKYDATFRDAATGKMIWSNAQSGNDIGRGMAADVDANNRGHEMWCAYYPNGGTTRTNAMFDTKGNIVANVLPSQCFRVYWDGDLQDELFDGKYSSTDGKSSPQLTYNDGTAVDFTKYNAQSCNTTKATPNLIADIFGDWREEIVLWDGETSSDLLIFTTTSASKAKVPCLMEDHNYRMAIAWQNVAYNQPPHLGYNLAATYDIDPSITIYEGPEEQTVTLGSPITPIKGTWKNMTKVAITASNGLVATVDEANKSFEISGTPTRLGKTTLYINSRGVSPSMQKSVVINVVEPVEMERIAYFPFDEIGATAENKVHGVATAFGSPSLVDGKVGKAVYFNGTTDYLSQDAYDLIQLGSNPFTVEFWFRSDDDAAYLIHKGSIKADADAGTTGNWWGVELKSGALNFAIDDDATKSGIKVNDCNKYFDNQWHYMVCVRDNVSKTIKLYVDAQLIGEVTDGTGAIADNNEPLVIGNVAVDLNNFYKGAIDELSIYSGAMPADQIALNYAASSVGNISIDSLDGPVRLTVVTTSGRVVAQGYGTLSSMTRNLPAGVYVLLRECNGYRETSKIVL